MLSNVWFPNHLGVNLIELIDIMLQGYLKVMIKVCKGVFTLEGDFLKESNKSSDLIAKKYDKIKIGMTSFMHDP